MAARKRSYTGKTDATAQRQSKRIKLSKGSASDDLSSGAGFTTEFNQLQTMNINYFKMFNTLVTTIELLSENAISADDKRTMGNVLIDIGKKFVNESNLTKNNNVKDEPHIQIPQNERNETIQSPGTGKKFEPKRRSLTIACTSGYIEEDMSFDEECMAGIKATRTSSCFDTKDDEQKDTAKNVGNQEDFDNKENQNLNHVGHENLLDEKNNITAAGSQNNKTMKKDKGKTITNAGSQNNNTMRKDKGKTITRNTIASNFEDSRISKNVTGNGSKLKSAMKKNKKQKKSVKFAYDYVRLFNEWGHLDTEGTLIPALNEGSDTEEDSYYEQEYDQVYVDTSVGAVENEGSSSSSSTIITTKRGTIRRLTIIKDVDVNKQ